MQKRALKPATQQCLSVGGATLLSVDSFALKRQTHPKPSAVFLINRTTAESMTQPLKVGIYAAMRTPFGALNGILKNQKAADFAGELAYETMESTRMSTAISGIICSTTWPEEALDTELDRITTRSRLYCGSRYSVHSLEGSGLQSIVCGIQEILYNNRRAVLCLGYDKMTSACDKVLMKYNPVAEKLANDTGTTKHHCDSFAALSQTRWIKAATDGIFKREIMKPRSGAELSDEVVSSASDVQQPPSNADFAITGASSAQYGDGAAAVILGKVLLTGPAKMATIIGCDVTGCDSGPYGCSASIHKAAQNAGIDVKEIDLFEIHEQHAIEVLANMNDLGIDMEKVNRHGGALAIGNPIAASGLRLMVHLVHELIQSKLRYGVASAGFGLGQGISILVEVEKQ